MALKQVFGVSEWLVDQTMKAVLANFDSMFRITLGEKLTKLNKMEIGVSMNLLRNDFAMLDQTEPG